MRYEHDIQLRLRGRRRYVHSTDIYPALIDHAQRAGASVVTDLKIDFSRIAKHQMRISIFKKGAAEISVEAPVAFSYRSSRDDISGYFFETRASVTETYPGDDDLIYERLQVNSEELTINDSAGEFEPIDVVAALVAKHEILERATEGRKWLIARLELAAPLPEQRPQVFQSQIERRLGSASIRSSLLIDGQKVGRVVLVQGVA